MSVKDITKELYLQLEKQGYRGKIVSIENLHELQRGIEEPYKKGLFAEEFYQEELTGFDFKIPNSLPKTKSLLIVAAPQPQIQVSFNLNGESKPLVIPPTYAYETDGHVKNLLASCSTCPASDTCIFIYANHLLPPLVYFISLQPEISERVS